MYRPTTAEVDRYLVGQTKTDHREAEAEPAEPQYGPHWVARCFGVSPYGLRLTFDDRTEEVLYDTSAEREAAIASMPVGKSRKAKAHPWHGATLTRFDNLEPPCH